MSTLVTPIHIKNNLDQCIQEAVEFKNSFGFSGRKEDFTRNRKLPMDNLIKLVLNFNRGSMPKEILACTDNEGGYTVSAALKARKKLKSEAFQFLFYRQNERIKENLIHPEDIHYYAVDGSDVRFYANENDPELQVNGSHGVMQGRFHLNALIDIDNHIVVDARLSEGRKNSEEATLIEFVENRQFDDKACLLGDRLYGTTFQTLAACQEADTLFLFRTKDLRSGTSFTRNVDYIPEEGEFDVDVCFHLTTKNSKKARSDPFYKLLQSHGTFKYYDPETMDYFELKFRLIRYKLETEAGNGDKYGCLVTNIDRGLRSASQLIDDFTKRWDIETCFKELKQWCSMIYFHSTQRQLIEQEIWASLTMFNFTQLLINLVGKIQKEKYLHKPNFALAAYKAREFFRTGKHAKSLLTFLEKNTNPIRKGRSSPRKVKPTGPIPFNNR